MRARKLFITLTPSKRSKRCDDGSLRLRNVYYYFEVDFREVPCPDRLEYAGTFLCHYFLSVVHKIMY